MAKRALDRINEAEKEAEVMVKEAKKKAGLIISEAKKEAEHMVDEAEREAVKLERDQFVLVSKQMSKRLFEVDEKIQKEAERLRKICEARKDEAIAKIIEIICS